MEPTVLVPAVLLRLDRAAHAGRLVLADRAAQALTSPAGSAQRRRGDL